MENGKVSDSYEKKSFRNEGLAKLDVDIDHCTNFSLQNCVVEYEPYPSLFATNVLDNGLYKGLVNTFPDESLFKFLSSSGDKYLLSEGTDIDKYLAHIHQHKEWAALYAMVKSVNFVRYCYTFLKKQNIDLGLTDVPVLFPSPNEVIEHRFITSRFEFSSMSANGGFHVPHTDIPKKLVSIVIPIMFDEEWKLADVGGTSICYPKDKSQVFNVVNYPLPLPKVDIIKRYPFLQNSAVIIAKTHNSWHCVEPVFNSNAPFRRTIVIQLIESK